MRVCVDLENILFEVTSAEDDRRTGYKQRVENESVEDRAEQHLRGWDIAVRGIRDKCEV